MHTEEFHPSNIALFLDSRYLRSRRFSEQLAVRLNNPLPYRDISGTSFVARFHTLPVEIRHNLSSEDIMKTLIISLALTVTFLLGTEATTAQPIPDTKAVAFSERNLGGPRLGLTFIPSRGKLREELEKREIGGIISQFGWHFEWQVIPDGGGPQFVVEFIPLVGGVEYGKILLSTTLGLGIRMPSGIEFGLGPNLLFGGEGAHTALMASIGKSFNYSGVSIPINLVWVTNPDGNRIGVIVGYAIAK
jgi:hypothetical protein